MPGGGGGGGGGPLGLTNEQLGERIIATYPGLSSQNDTAPYLAQELEYTSLGESAVHLLKRTVGIEGNPDSQSYRRNEAARLSGRTGCKVACDLRISGSRAELQKAELLTGRNSSKYCTEKDANIFIVGQR